MATGVPFIAVGVAIIKFGRPWIDFSNRVYARLPGRFQYPSWYHYLFGTICCAFGLLIIVVALVFI